MSRQTEFKLGGRDYKLKYNLRATLEAEEMKEEILSKKKNVSSETYKTLYSLAATVAVLSKFGGMKNITTDIVISDIDTELENGEIDLLDIITFVSEKVKEAQSPKKLKTET
jgi:hypothetical protein